MTTTRRANIVNKNWSLKTCKEKFQKYIFLRVLFTLNVKYYETKEKIVILCFSMLSVLSA